jgi:hypothetical protein
LISCSPSPRAHPSMWRIRKLLGSASASGAPSVAQPCIFWYSWSD